MIVVALAGGVGAATRFALDGLIGRSSLPWGTIIINLSGSLLLGFVLGLGAGFFAPEPWVQVLGIGFFGGYTTFSTASFESVTLLRERRIGAALFTTLGILILATAMAGFGFWLGLLSAAYA